MNMKYASKWICIAFSVFVVGQVIISYIEAPAKPIERSVRQQLKDMHDKIERLFTRQSETHNAVWEEFKELNVKWDTWERERQEYSGIPKTKIVRVGYLDYQPKPDDKVVRQYENFKLIQHTRFKNPIRFSLIRYDDNAIVDRWVGWETQEVFDWSDRRVTVLKID